MNLLYKLKTELTRQACFNPGDSTLPVAVLWPDPDAQWQPIVAMLSPISPGMFTLGKYDVDNKSGPAIWIRCVIANTLPEIERPEGEVPVLYLPNVSRQQLRSVEDCPEYLQPLVELQYRGTTWLQRNGKDWTVEAFLVSEEGGLGLDLAQDKRTRQSLLLALKELAVCPIDRLKEKKLEAEDFDRLMVEDTPHELLSWMNNPEECKNVWSEEKWTAFNSRCKEEYAFDPEKDGDIIAGEKLGKCSDNWQGVWKRYEVAPALYPNIEKLLRRAKPAELLFVKETWPDENEGAETTLRAALTSLEKKDAETARNTIIQLEKEHGVRRNWVWNKLNYTPLANSLKHLSQAAEITGNTLGGNSLQMLVSAYCEKGYLADTECIEAMACVKKSADIEAVSIAIKAIYLPWADQTARQMQQLITETTMYSHGALHQAEDGEVLLFVDGLRFEAGKTLCEMLQRDDLSISFEQRLSVFPTVTATAKYATSPVGDKLTEGDVGTFSPTVSGGGKLSIDKFRKLLDAESYQVIDSNDYGNPLQAGAKGWTEFGEFDSLGHKLQRGLAAQIHDQLMLVGERISGLLAAGWKKVRIITDHGWLFLPGGLPSVPLAKYLTESRWSRCASVKETGHVELPVYPGFWNKNEYVAVAPGVACFTNGNEYSHGGISLQECVIPVITIQSTAAVRSEVRIVDVQWLSLRCRVSLSNAAGSLRVDLRTKVADKDSSVLVDKEPRMVDKDGRAGVLVEDETLTGTAVFVVVIDENGNVLAKQPTSIGGE
jgi:hypothetical protein